MLVTSIVVIGWNLNPLWFWSSATVANGLTLLVCLRSLFIVAPMQLKNSLKMYYDLNWSVFAINGSYMCLYTSNVCTRAFTK